MKRLVKGILLLALTLVGTRAAAQSATATADSLAVDTVSTAVATVWSAHISPVLEQRYANDSVATAEFVRGITEAFNITADREPYYQGVLQGITIQQRLKQMRELGFPISRDTFIAALAVALSGKPTGFTPASADRYLSDFIARRMEAQQAADTLSVESQKAFLARESAKEGAITTPSGLIFQIITEGEGEGPTLDDAVKLVYTGRLYNGEVFDSSEGEEVTFPVSGLVPGFTQGLLMMKPGGTYRIIIPAELGYGARGTAGVIPGNAALDFTITLNEVVKR